MWKITGKKGLFNNTLQNHSPWTRHPRGNLDQEQHHREKKPNPNQERTTPNKVCAPRKTPTETPDSSSLNQQLQDLLLKTIKEFDNIINCVIILPSIVTTNKSLVTYLFQMRFDC